MRWASIALLFGAAGAVAGPNASDAVAIRAFLGRIYASYKECPSGGTKCPEPVSWKTAFTPDTRRLIELNEKLNDYEAGAATDVDPLCQCQDHETIKIVSIKLSDRRDGRVKADLRFTNFGPRRVSLIMERTSAGWRVFDVVGDATVLGYRDSIIADNRSLSSPPR
jgi:hypothetical protein